MLYLLSIVAEEEVGLAVEPKWGFEVEIRFWFRRGRSLFFFFCSYNSYQGKYQQSNKPPSPIPPIVDHGKDVDPRRASYIRIYQQRPTKTATAARVNSTWREGQERPREKKIKEISAAGRGEKGRRKKIKRC